MHTLNECRLAWASCQAVEQVIELLEGTQEHILSVCCALLHTGSCGF